MLMTYIQVRLD